MGIGWCAAKVDVAQVGMVTLRMSKLMLWVGSIPVKYPDFFTFLNSLGHHLPVAVLFRVSGNTANCPAGDAEKTWTGLGHACTSGSLGGLGA